MVILVSFEIYCVSFHANSGQDQSKTASSPENAMNSWKWNWHFRLNKLPFGVRSRNSVKSTIRYINELINI